MNVFEPVTYRFIRPISGAIREDDRTASWTIEEVTFDFLTSGQTPPSDDLVFNCQHTLRDEGGGHIPVEILSLLNLEQGLRVAFRTNFAAAMDALRAA